MACTQDPQASRPKKRPRTSTRLGSRNSTTHIGEVNNRLLLAYGTPDLGNVRDVFGELVYALLSTRSSQANYRGTFQTLQSRFRCWPELVNSSEADLAVLLRPCGLQNRKARAILAICRKVFVHQGYRDLEHLRTMSTGEVEEYLTSLPEVGAKVAKCVSLYALDHPVFPIDVHNMRILRRMGMVEEARISPSLVSHIESLIPPSMRRDLHVNLIVHGRTVCNTHPACSVCILRDLCNYGSAREHQGWL